MADPAPVEKQLTTNQRVLTWVRGNVGTMVGKGECWDLAELALKQAGALTSNDFGKVTKDADYVWGDKVEKLEDVLPGDILQFRNHVTTTITREKVVFRDGSWAEKTSTKAAKRPHHTAIVNSMPDTEGVVQTFDQHVMPLGRVVQNLKLHIRNLGPITSITKEKRENPATKMAEEATVETTVTVRIEGTIWAYRPRSKAN